MKMNRNELEAQVINSNNSSSSSSSSANEHDDTRQRIEAWMGLGNNSKKSTATTRVTTPTKKTITTTTSTITTKPWTSYNEPQQELKPVSQDSSPTIPKVLPITTAALTRQKLQLKSILKPPKYSSLRITPALSDLEEAQRRASLHVDHDDDSTTTIALSNVTTPAVVVVKGRVVERLHPVAQPLPQRQQVVEAATTEHTASMNDTLAIEGYLPSTTSSREARVSFQEKSQMDDNHNDDDIDDDDDSDASSIILTSMDDLFSVARRGSSQQHPHQQQQPLDRSMARLETELEFSCMAPEEYEDSFLHLPEGEERRQLQEEERRLHYEVFAGRMDAFGNYSHEEDVNDEHFHDDEPNHNNILLHHANHDEDDLALMDVSQPQDDEHDDDNDEHAAELEDLHVLRQPLEPRAFSLLWTAITQWVTPHSVALLEEWKQQQQDETTTSRTTTNSHVLSTVADRSDVEASRCAGLQAMLKMNLPRAMEELHLPTDLRKFLDIHLAELLSTFDYTYPIAVKMDMNMWRAMTCVFVDMVLTFSSKEQQAKYNMVGANYNMKPSGAVHEENNPPGNDSQQNVTIFPESAQAAGLKVEEYRYLVQSAISTLGCHPEET
jgi:hypothetical protein